MTLTFNQRLQEIGMKCLAAFFLLFCGGICVVGFYVNTAGGFYYTAILPAVVFWVVLSFFRLLWNTDGLAPVGSQEHSFEEAGDADEHDAAIAASIFSTVCVALLMVDNWLPHNVQDERSLSLWVIVVAAFAAAIANAFLSKKAYGSYVFGSLGYGVALFGGIGLIYLVRVVMHIY